MIRDEPTAIEPDSLVLHALSTREVTEERGVIRDRSRVLDATGRMHRSETIEHREDGPTGRQGFSYAVHGE